MSTATLADDCETIYRVLADAPKEGLTLDEMIAAAGWTHHRTTATILALGGRIVSEARRERGRKVTRYTLKGRS